MTTLKKFTKRIEINPRRLGGKPVIRGTRVSVEHILRLIALGIQEKEILIDFPQLTHKDILAAVDYAARLVEDFDVYPKAYLGAIAIQPA
ncbi:MAG: DUF433 domain-containing protein [Candidatus Magasanikbacteria bacterium]|nr:DUF433 domain-containing protein [Candidatus Magasanikbacteria bacterium]